MLLEHQKTVTQAIDELTTANENLHRLVAHHANQVVNLYAETVMLRALVNKAMENMPEPHRSRIQNALEKLES